MSENVVVKFNSDLIIGDENDFGYMLCERIKQLRIKIGKEYNKTLPLINIQDTFYNSPQSFQIYINNIEVKNEYVKEDFMAEIIENLESLYKI